MLTKFTTCTLCLVIIKDSVCQHSTISQYSIVTQGILFGALSEIVIYLSSLLIIFFYEVKLKAWGWSFVTDRVEKYK